MLSQSDIAHKCCVELTDISDLALINFEYRANVIHWQNLIKTIFETRSLLLVCTIYYFINFASIMKPQSLDACFSLSRSDYQTTQPF